MLVEVIITESYESILFKIKIIIQTGTHVKKTGEVRPIKIARMNHRANKKELEFVYELQESDSNNNNNKTNVKAKGKGKSEAAKTDTNTPNTAKVDDVHALTNHLFDLFFDQLQAKNIDIQVLIKLRSTTTNNNLPCNSFLFLFLGQTRGDQEELRASI